MSKTIFILGHLYRYNGLMSLVKGGCYDENVALAHQIFGTKENANYPEIIFAGLYGILGTLLASKNIAEVWEMCDTKLS